MTYDQVVKHFGTEQGVADALGISRQAVNLWKHAENQLVSEGMAYKIQVITAGRMRVDPAIYRRKRMTA